MADERLRELERRWKETGSTEDEAAWLLERSRVGDLTKEALELAGLLGHPGCQRLRTHETPQGRREWVRAGVLLARHLGSSLEESRAPTFFKLLSNIERCLAGGWFPPSVDSLRREVERWKVGTDHVEYCFGGLERHFAYSVLFAAEAAYVPAERIPQSWNYVVSVLREDEEMDTVIGAILGRKP